MIKPFAHQLESLDFLKTRNRVFDMSDAGTGKTLVEIKDYERRRAKGGGKALVLAPKSLLKAAWFKDFRKFAPDLRVSLAYAENRWEAMSSAADVYVTNFDAVKDLQSELPPKFWSDFDTLIVDESTAFKHHTSQRSRALAKLTPRFEVRRLMSGTPTSNGILDIWHQMFLLDGGKHLGANFNKFRSAVCIPEQVGPMPNMIKWHEREGIEDTVMALIKDMVIRHEFEQCTDIPRNHRYSAGVSLPAKLWRVYKQLEEDSLAIAGSTTITAVNGAVLAQKLLQAASGAVYNDDGGYSSLATDRYELVLDLVEARKHSIVFYQWDHQREELVKEAKKRGVRFVVWDSDRPEIEEEYQSGEYQVMLAHPASAGHGLTLTRGTATIWVSPTYNLEWFLQGYKRIYRIGQTEETETIVCVAEGTVDEHVYEQMLGKKIKMDRLFSAIAAEKAGR